MGKRASIILLAALTLIISVATITQAADENRAAVVVSLGGGEVVSRCVSFSEPEISGFELLQRSGLQVVVDDQAAGAAICSISGTGCPTDDCFCECRGGGDCTYWSYWHRENEAWNYSAGGSSIYRISDGMMDGWSWGPGSVTGAIEPPPVSFSDVCAVETEPTSTPTATTAAIVIPSVVAAAETPQGGSPTSTIQPTAPSLAVSTVVPTVATPTVRPQTSSDSSAEATLPPQPTSTEPDAEQPLGQLQSPAATPTAAFEGVAQVQPDQPQPEPSATPEVHPESAAVAEIAAEEQGGNVVVERPGLSVVENAEPPAMPPVVAVIGSGAAPESEPAVADETNITESQTATAVNWRQYVVFAAMLLALAALIGAARLRSRGSRGRS